MDWNISLATAIEWVTIAYVASGVILLTASNIGLAIIETIEEFHK